MSSPSRRISAPSRPLGPRCQSPRAPSLKTVPGRAINQSTGANPHYRRHHHRRRHQPAVAMQHRLRTVGYGHAEPPTAPPRPRPNRCCHPPRTTADPPSQSLPSAFHPSPRSAAAPHPPRPQVASAPSAPRPSGPSPTQTAIVQRSASQSASLRRASSALPWTLVFRLAAAPLLDLYL